MPCFRPPRPRLHCCCPAQRRTPAKLPRSSTGPSKDRRLIILFFDLTSMQPDEIDRATAAAQNYVDKQMVPADLVAVVSLGSSLSVNQDFTSDRALLKKALQALQSRRRGRASKQGSTGTTEGTADTGGSFTVDDTEYNIFNTDRRLEALRSVADKLATIKQKKSLIYFSSGMDRTGIENQSQLRSATNAAVRANMAIYTMDIRGLQAMVPGGEAQNASLRGTSPYSGESVANAVRFQFHHPGDAGHAGRRHRRARLSRLQRFRQGLHRRAAGHLDCTTCSAITARTPARDGRFRRITVRVNRPGVKLEFRRGYYAPRDFQHSTQDDRERQLDEELASDLPTTDLPVYLVRRLLPHGEAAILCAGVAGRARLANSVHPARAIRTRPRSTCSAVVQRSEKAAGGQMRDTVKLAVNTSQQVRRKNVQYNTGFVLPPGKYHLKFVVRENQSGRLGSFETDLTIPDLKSAPVKMSSVVLANQLQPAGKHKNDNPLVRDGSEVIPSVTHVFSAGQHLYLYYEVYDPAHARTNSSVPAGIARRVHPPADQRGLLSRKRQSV